MKFANRFRRSPNAGATAIAAASKAGRPSITPLRRDLRFDLPADQITAWHTAAGPNFTAFLNTFSIVLPVGERYFIDSVRAFRDQLSDAELQRAVTAFIGQEAMHGREHEAYNDALFAQVPVAARFERLVGGLLRFMQKNTRPSWRLSTTIALEHLTALLAHGVLADPRVSAGADERFADVWRWHALEETEHKAVAFDVWEAVMGRGPLAYAERSLGLLSATAIFWGMIIPAYLLVLKQQGVLTDAKAWRGFYRYALGDIGLIRKLVRPWADYFRPDFHPWDHDNRAFLSRIDDFVSRYQAKPSTLRAAA